MLKLTDPNYKLPKIEALTSNKVFSTGTTQPMLLRGVDRDTGLRGEFVVKYSKSPRMTINSMARELLGLWIGRELGLNMAEPVLINVSKPFADSLKGNEGYLNAQNSVGLNFGSVYVAGYMEMINNKHFPDLLFKEAKEIFAFDMFISNADRRFDKPNFLTNGKNFLVFDHELAFSFVMLLFKNPTPWIMGDLEKEMYKNHFFYPYFKNTNINFDEFINRFTLINDYFWERVYQFMPKEWQTEEIEIIKNYLASITSNKEEFSKELTRILL